MFIKLHDKGKEVFANMDNTNIIQKSDNSDYGTAIWFCGSTGSFTVDETPEEIMKIIAYFKVGEK